MLQPLCRCAALCTLGVLLVDLAAAQIERRPVRVRTDSQYRVERDPQRNVRVVRRGSVTQLPAGHRTVVVRGRTYHVHNDRFYLAVGGGSRPRYVITRPPVGGFVTVLPSRPTAVVVNGVRLYRCEDVYFRETLVSGVDGYEVVETPPGAPLEALPEDFRTELVNGEELVVIDGEYYRAEQRGSERVFVRVAGLGGAAPVQPPPSNWDTRYEPQTPGFPRDFSMPDVITGNLVTRDRGVLPAGAEATIRLIDVSRSDGIGITVSEQVYATLPGLPMPFELRIDPARIDPQRSYVVQARIAQGGQLLYINQTPAPVLTRGAGSRVDLVLDSARLPESDRTYVPPPISQAPISQAPISQPPAFGPGQLDPRGGGLLVGVVNYRERMGLLPGATVEVRLLDVGADNRAELIAEERFNPSSQVPIPYRLTYDPARIRQGARLIVDVVIRNDSRIMFRGSAAPGMAGGLPDRADVLVLRTP